MVHSRTWTIGIRISEHKHEEDDDRGPSDKGVHGYGEELATARSLADFADPLLLELSRDDVKRFTRGPGRLL